MAAVAAGRIKLALDLVQGHEIAAVRHLPVRPHAVPDGGFHLDLVGMAVVAERALVAVRAEAVVRGSIKAVVFNECRRVAEHGKWLHGSLLLVFMAFRAIHLLSHGQGFGM